MTPAALFAGGLAAGLVAGTASCTAVQGGLLVALAGGGRRVVPGFIAGRMASHVLAGALLGALGAVVRIPPAARAVLLVAAGAAVIVFAVRLIGKARHERSCSTGPPPAVTPASPARAAAVGAATILIPCGVTLSSEVIAVSSGSWLGGAAVMAGFVAGTAPRSPCSACWSAASPVPGRPSRRRSPWSRRWPG